MSQFVAVLLLTAPLTSYRLQRADLACSHQEELLMDPQLVLAGAQEALSVRRVFGDPIQADGVVVIPVAKVSGGGGGGAKTGEEGGAGYGMSARPAGVYVIRGGEARWRPAVDLNRVILGGQLVAITALLTLGPIVRRWLASRSAAV